MEEIEDLCERILDEQESILANDTQPSSFGACQCDDDSHYVVQFTTGAHSLDMDNGSTESEMEFLRKDQSFARAAAGVNQEGQGSGLSLQTPNMHAPSRCDALSMQTSKWRTGQWRMLPFP